MSHLFLTNNLVDDANLAMITGVENSQFPLSNLQDPFTTKVVRVDGNTVEIEVDLKTTSQIDTIAVVGSSIDGLGFTTMSVFGSVTGNFTGATEHVLDVSQEFNFGFKQITEVNYRFWKIKLTNTGSYNELSNIFIGKAVTMPDNGFSQDSFGFVNVDNSTVKQNKYGNRFIDKYNTLQRLTGEIKFMSEAERIILEEISVDKGISTPFFFITDPENVLGTDAKYRYSGYYYLNKSLSFKGINGLLFNTKLDLGQAG